MSRHAAIACCFVLAGCTGTIETPTGAEGDTGAPEELVGAVEDDSVTFSTTLAAGDWARVCNCSALNQRSGPSTGYSILRTMPQGSSVRILERDGNWFRNDWSGRVGWSHGSYLCKVESGDEGGGELGWTTTNSRDAAIARAKLTVGFSYWWGGARLNPAGSHGACYGSCPDCSHSGSYGADCSGYVGKLWVVPEAMPLDANLHPFSTYSFYHQTTHWGAVARSSLLRADALVYRSSSSGHIFLYESGDGWGSMWAYEARGCSTGIVRNLRTASSSYKGIRRHGI